MHPRTSGEGGVGVSDACGESSHKHMTPPTSHFPFLSNENLASQSTKPLIPYVSATASNRRMLDGTKQGVNAEISNDNAQAAFHVSSHVTTTGTHETTFLVDDNLVPIKLKKIPSIYTLFNLLFAI